MESLVGVRLIGSCGVPINTVFLRIPIKEYTKNTIVNNSNQRARQQDNIRVK